MIKPAKLSDIKIHRRRGQRQADIMEFYDSDMESCEVILSPEEQAENVLISYRNAIVRLGTHTIKEMLSDGHIYLVKTKVNTKVRA